MCNDSQESAAKHERIHRSSNIELYIHILWCRLSIMVPHGIWSLQSAIGLIPLETVHSQTVANYRVYVIFSHALFASVTRNPPVFALIYDRPTGYIPRELLKIPTLSTFNLENNNCRGDQTRRKRDRRLSVRVGSSGLRNLLAGNRGDIAYNV